MSTYHLWLKPSGSAYTLLATTIAELARTYDGPLFEPHVTLLSNLPGAEEEVAARAAQLANSLEPFEIQLGGPGYKDQYFQCLFLQVAQAPGIMEAHQHARRTFLKHEAYFMPHLSVLYGNYPPALKEQIIPTLSRNLAVRLSVDKVDLIRADSDDPKDWVNIGIFPFRG